MDQDEAGLEALTEDTFSYYLFHRSKILGIRNILNRLKDHIRRVVSPEKESVSSKCRPRGRPRLKNSHRRVFPDNELACPNASDESQPCRPKQHRFAQAQGHVHEVTPSQWPLRCLCVWLSNREHSGISRRRYECEMRRRQDAAIPWRKMCCWGGRRCQWDWVTPHCWDDFVLQPPHCPSQPHTFRFYCRILPYWPSRNERGLWANNLYMRN